ncbi:hypothetical protein [Flavobacterium sp. LM5]|uniref:hypothetical protein n=1 Tax=Flavobacterium sp. LM5 TaxID=1938610 RepID=UPI00166FB663|nr:hypothetical protein [Flavobacterium sp. LM5]
MENGCFISLLHLKKRTFTKVTAIASHTKTLYCNEKIKNEMHPNFTCIKEYIHKIGSSF